MCKEIMVTMVGIEVKKWSIMKGSLRGKEGFIIDLYINMYVYILWFVIC